MKNWGASQSDDHDQKGQVEENSDEVQTWWGQETLKGRVGS